MLVVVACTPLPPRNPLATWVASENHDVRRPVLIVLHYTDEPSLDAALRILRSQNSGGPVSAHYLIGSDGHIFQLVRDQQRAWHAGGGRWGTITDVNSASIGVELDNDGDSPFAHEQIDSLLRLLDDLTTRFGIPRTQVIGHEDMAPSRKVDPGPLFPWHRLAQEGFGLWPRDELAEAPPGFDPWLAMAVVGYSLDDRAGALRAFHHHFRGIDGQVQLDALDARILYDLSRQIMQENPSELP